MLIEIEKRHSGIEPKSAITEIEKFGYQSFFVDEDFELKSTNASINIRNNNFIFIPN